MYCADTKNRFRGLALILVFITLFSAAFSSAAQEVEEDTTPEDIVATEAPDDPLSSEEARLQERLAALLDRREDFIERLRNASGEELLIFERQNWQRQLETHTTIRGLVDNLLRQEAEGRDVSEQRRELQKFLKANYSKYPDIIERHTRQVVSLREQLDADPEADKISLEQKITEGENRLQQTHQVLVEILPAVEALDLEVASKNTQASQLVAERAEKIAARVEIQHSTLEDLKKRLVSSPDDAALKQEMEITSLRLNRSTDNLSATVALMAALDLDPVQYQQLLIVATGEITADILKKEVALGLFQRWRDNVAAEITTEGPSWLVKVAFFLLILAGFRLLAALVRRLVSKSVSGSRVNISRLLQDTLVSWSSRIVMTIGILVALGQLGVQIGPLLTGLGIAGFIIGFALQDSLSNFAAGTMILVYEPFDEGDVVEAAGIKGKVSRMSLVSTTILTFDNQTLMVPNNKIWGDVIRNVTAQELRRVDLVFATSYKDDVEKVEKVLFDILASHEKVLKDPEPMVKLNTLGVSSVEFVVRPWCHKEDYWDVYWDLTREVRVRFEKEGISRPHPQHDVQLIQPEDSSTQQT